MSTAPSQTEDESVAAPDSPLLDAVFLNALGVPDGPERAAFLDRACGDDELLRQRIEVMLTDDTAAEAFFEGGETQVTPQQPMGAWRAASRLCAEAEGDAIGHYHLQGILGEGGFGTVWKARQAQPVQRTVALKIIKPGMDTQEVLARFEQERQALAMMDHPGIARVFDAGATAAGRPYFVMELIIGDPVTKYCDSRQMDTSGRLRLMADVCSAVQHAHQKGIIHRDLKPSNVLVADFENGPAAKIIDFGIAKAVAPGGDGTHPHTRADQFIGTPAYMSPEQASLNGQDVDTRSDIYALGVLLYQLLTGTTPFEGKTSRGASLDEIRRIIRDEEPPPPSTAVGRLKADVLANVLKTRQTALRELSQLLRRDLDWIVMKALEKDRTRRYESASALAADIRRDLAGEPVAARPPTFSYRAGKFIRRRKGPVAAATAVLLALSGGLAASTTLFLREKNARSRESQERAKAQRESANNAQTAKFLSDLLAGASPDVAKGMMPTLLDIVERAVQQLGTGMQDQPAIEATLRNTIGSTFFSLGRFAEAKAQFEAGLKLARVAAGEKDRLTLRLRGNLANILHAARDYQKAEAENRAILTIRESEFPPNDIETLATRDNLATEISKQGRLAEAATEYRALLSPQRTALGEDHADTLRTRMALANTESRRGYMMLYELSHPHPDKPAVTDVERVKAEATTLFVEQEKEFRDVVAHMEQVPALGPKHPQTLETRYALADVLAFQDKHSDAEKEHRAVAELRHDVLGAAHKKTFQSRAGAARAIAGQGRLGEALAGFRAIIADQNATPQRDEGDYQNNLDMVKRLESGSGRQNQP